MENDVSRGATVKTWLEVFRESLVILVVLIVAIFPKTTAVHLHDLGFTTLRTPVGDVDLAQVAGGVRDARLNVSDSVAALDEISKNLPPSPIKERVDLVVSDLKSTADHLQGPDQILATAVRRQAEASQNPTAREGWIYLGHVDESKKDWTPVPTAVKNASPQFKPGDVVAVSDDLYLRADSSTTQRNQAPVIGVVRSGQQVHVLDIGYTHSLRGGWFIWLKVTVD
jgi:hypothetical protein